MLETFKGMLGTFKGKVENQREENMKVRKDLKGENYAYSDF